MKPQLKLNNYIKFADKNTKIDTYLVANVLILFGFGIIMLYSASYPTGIYKWNDPYHFVRGQVIFGTLGLLLMFFIAQLDYHILQHCTKLALFGTYFLLFITLFMPEINYARRWIVIPGAITFQPSELAKFTIILVFADLIEKKGDKMETFHFGVVPFVVVLLPVVLLLILEPHISGTIIICAIAAILMYVGGTKKRWFFLAAGIVIAFVILIVLVQPSIIDRAMYRIEAWQNPESDLQGAGYQSYQSLLAIGSGGLFGLGLGNSRQKHMHLPEPQNDFIFAVICEELGFIGGMIVILLFLFLLFRGIYVAMKAEDKFGALLIIGIISQICLQAFLNIGVATNVLPNTGISLPFFSDGGTSLLMILVEMGVVLSVSRSCKTTIPRKNEKFQS